MSRLLQSQIHSERNTDSGTWSGYYSDISALTGLNMQDMNDHIIREFNRKVIQLGFTTLTFNPYDAGFRFLGNVLSGAPAIPSNPTHSLLPILGTNAVKYTWFDNDEESDAYTTEIAMASHLLGLINIVGISQTASTDGDGYNPTLTGSYIVADAAVRSAIITGDMPQSSWNTSSAPTLYPLFTGHLGAIATPFENTTKANYTPATLSAFTGAVNTYGSTGNPLLFCAGGQLTFLAEAWLSQADAAARAAFASKVTVLLVAGNQSSTPASGGYYNEWADAAASRIVHANFNIINFSATYPNVTQAVVTKQNILDRLPDSVLRARMYNKARPGNILPADMDGDGNPFLCILNTGFVTGVTRRIPSGTAANNQGGLGPSRSMDTFADNSTGNVWAVAVDQSVATSTWWNTITTPSLWMGGTSYTFSSVTGDSFDRANGSLGAGWEQLGSITRNSIISNQVGISAGPAYAYDRSTATYNSNQYCQIQYAAGTAAGKFSGPAINL